MTSGRRSANPTKAVTKANRKRGGNKLIIMLLKL